MSPRSGEDLAHCRVERKNGEGGTGEVRAATDARLIRPAAVEALRAAPATDPERLARFRREARLLAARGHPNIAAIHGLEQVDEASPDGLRFLLVVPWEDESAEAGTVRLLRGWRRLPESTRGTRDG